MPRTDPAGVQRRLAAAVVAVGPLLDGLAQRFADEGHELALVGGWVRDAALGRPSQDLDLATSARPEQTLALLAGWASQTWETGIAFGTVGALHDGQRVEITTYRADAYRPDSRKPDVRLGDDLVGDLRRRDFTVNAMAVTLPQRRFVDPFDGLADLAAGRLATPAPAAESFADDPLRMLRAARFAAQLGLRPDPAVVEAMVAAAGRLSIVSAERVRDELTKLLLADRPRAGLALLVDTGLADQVLPELPALRLEVDEHHRHKDVYEHTLTVLEQAIDAETPPAGPVPAPDLVLRLAALLHDIGKPKTRRFEPGGGVSFHHHELVGAKLARTRLSALRYPGAVVDDVAELVALHLRFHGYGEGGWTDSAVRRYVRDAGPLLERLHRLTRADCTTRNPRLRARLSRSYDELEARIAALAAQEEMDAVRPDLDGNAIMTILGLPPGPEVGRAYRHLLELRLDHGPLGADRAEAELRSWWAAQQPG